nr:hypothetical protein [Tanacetum cinerariifolium]
PDVPSDDSEEELSWNSFDDKDGDEQTKGREESKGDKTDESDDDNDDDNDETIKAGSKSLVRKQGYKKKRRHMTCIVTSISIREGAYK